MGELLPVTVMYVEDEREVSEVVAHVLKSRFAAVQVCSNGREALRMVSRTVPDILVTDLSMPEMGGLDLIPLLRKKAPDIPVVITTAFTEVPHLMKAIELGVSAFVSKPLDLPEFLDVVMKAAQPVVQRREIEALNARTASVLAMQIGGGARFAGVVRDTVDASNGDHRTLLEGEPGTGKTRLAATIHGMSRRKDRPFATVCCSNFPDEQLETELFGKKRSRIGIFEVAGRGTALLQHVEKASPAIQKKIVNVVETGEYIPVGEQTPRPLQCRVMATVHDGEAVPENLRLSLCEQVIKLPSLREMPDGIADLAGRLLLQGAEDLRVPVPLLSEDAVLFLMTYSWPGNIRELKAVLRRAVVRCQGRITSDDLRDLLVPSKTNLPLPTVRIEELEKLAIREAIAKAGGKKMLAADLMGLDYQRFKRKMARYWPEGAE